MAARVRAFDWARTVLGSMERWPEALRVAVDICLNSRFPMFVWWGPQLINIYNDAYVPILGKRHPSALGRPARESWAEIWDVIGPQADQVMLRGEATWNERVLLVMERHGFREDTYFTWSYSPIRDAEGRVAGLFCACTEETERVRAEDERVRIEAALRESEGRFRALVNASSDVLYRMTADWSVMQPLDGRGLVRSNTEPISDWMEHNIPAAEHARVRQAIARAIAARSTFELEHRVNRPDGSPGWTSSRAVPILSPTGEITEWFGAATDVTDRRATEAALRGSDERYARQLRLFEQIASSTPDFIYVFDLEGRFVYANRRLLEVWGRTFEDAVGKNLYELNYPTWHADMHVREIRQVIETRQPIRGEVPFTGGSGISGVYEYIFTPVLGADGNVEFVAGTTRDVTERRRTEARDRFLLALDETVRPLTEPDEITAVHARLLAEYLGVDRCAYADVEADEDTFNLTGDYTRGDVPSIVGRYRFAQFGQECLRLMRANEPYVVHDIDAHQPPPDDLSAYRQTQIQAVICVPLHKAGRFVAAMAVHQKTPRQWNPAEVDLVQAVAGRCWESIERGRVLRALRGSEARFRELADAMPQIVWVTRPDGYHEYYNHRWYEFTGVPAGSTDGEGWNGLFHPDDQPIAWAKWRHSLATGEPYEIEYRLRHHSGSYRWTLGRALPVRNEQGHIERWFGTCTDIDAMKRLTAEREDLLERERRARAEAERASEAKSDFLATLSHELRTPLTPVLLTVSLMESSPDLPAQLREDVATIRRNVELESRLISDLLDLTRISKGKLQLDEREVDLHLIVRSAVDICQREASAKLTVELNATRHTVRGDSTRLQQILWNLINNAIKFTPAEGTVTVRSEDALNGRIRVEVSDTGVGIDAALLPKLFDAFEQGEVRAARQQAGLGLGLTISKRLAEAHGGTITASSRGRGHGSTFIVELPIAATATEAHVEPNRPRAVITASPQPLSVLLVEDHEPTLRAMERLLRHIGHRVTAVSSVASATAVAHQQNFDVMVSDLGLPDGSGLDVMRKLKSRFAGRAIALTGYGMESDIAASRDAGFVTHLTKPVDLAALDAAIRDVVETAPRR